MIPRAGDPPRSDIAYVRRPGAYAILKVPGGLLLTEQRTDDICELQLPGGGIDAGESPLPALAREVLEETGWTCRVMRRVGLFRHFTWMPDYHVHAEKVCHVYLGRAGQCLGPAREVGHRAVILPVERAAVELPSPGNRVLLRRVMRQFRL